MVCGRPRGSLCVAATITMAGRNEVIKLYKSLMREGAKFSNYNFRMYTLRRVRDSFRDKRHVKDAKEIESLMSFGKENLDVLQRQVFVDNLYKNEHIVIDKNEQVPSSKLI